MILDAYFSNDMKFQTMLATGTRFSEDILDVASEWSYSEGNVATLASDKKVAMEFWISTPRVQRNLLGSIPSFLQDIEGIYRTISIPSTGSPTRRRVSSEEDASPAAPSS